MAVNKFAKSHINTPSYVRRELFQLTRRYGNSAILIFGVLTIQGLVKIHIGTGSYVYYKISPSTFRCEHSATRILHKSSSGRIENCCSNRFFEIFIFSGHVNVHKQVKILLNTPSYVFIRFPYINTSI